MYHTQEKRTDLLTAPIICVKLNAWLGDAFYFWYEMKDARLWGRNFKNATGKYEIYKATIDCEDVLDTVFNEQHYTFWREQVEAVARLISDKTRKKATLKEVNLYFKQRGNWNNISGIMFQDIPENYSSTLINDFFYRKRIQLAVYKMEIISNFELDKVEKC